MKNLVILMILGLTGCSHDSPPESPQWQLQEPQDSIVGGDPGEDDSTVTLRLVDGAIDRPERFRVPNTHQARFSFFRAPDSFEVDEDVSKMFDTRVVQVPADTERFVGIIGGGGLVGGDVKFQVPAIRNAVSYRMGESDSILVLVHPTFHNIRVTFGSEQPLNMDQCVRFFVETPSKRVVFPEACQVDEEYPFDPPKFELDIKRFWYQERP